MKSNGHSNSLVISISDASHASPEFGWLIQDG